MAFNDLLRRIRELEVRPHPAPRAPRRHAPP